MNLRWQMLVLCWTIASIQVFGQDCHRIQRGRVEDGQTGRGLPYVNVLSLRSGAGAFTDDQGNFVLEDLCEGPDTLQMSYIGYETTSVPVVVGAERDLHLHLQPSAIALEDVVIEGRIVADKPLEATALLVRQDLVSSRGLNLGESLGQLPGVSVLQTGATIAKPIVRGLHSNRVLILNNGVRHEAQQWGTEHAPEIDPFLADQVTVVKGAGGLRYGADALGGVIRLEPRPLPESSGIAGELNTQFLTNGRTGILNGIIEGKLNGPLPLSARGQATVKRGGNLHTPDYFLRNTGLEEANASWALGLKKSAFEVEFFYSFYYNKVGILRDAHIGNLTDLENALKRGRPLEDGSFTYAIDRPVQRNTHELMKLEGGLRTGDVGRLQLRLSRQFNRRQEFDAHRPFGGLPDNLDSPDIEFEITSFIGDLYWKHKPVANLHGEIGMQGIRQFNTTDRGGLIPDFGNWRAGIWWIERWKNFPSPWEFEWGLRYDGQWMEADIDLEEGAEPDRQFHNLSATLGGSYRFAKHFQARLNLSSAWRAPHVSELYSDGVHHGSASYEKGNPLLQSERAWNTGLGLAFDDHSRLRISIDLYYNRIQDYIFLMPREDPILTIRGAFPAFDYDQADVAIAGFEWHADYDLPAGWSIGSQGAFLWGNNLDLEEPLIFMPPNELRHGIYYRFKWKGVRSEETPRLGLRMINVFEQKRVPQGVDYAPPPPGHTRLELEGRMTVQLGKQPFELGLTIYNLTNTRYRQYLNRLRYYADEPGLNASLHLRVPLGR